MSDVKVLFKKSCDGGPTDTVCVKQLMIIEQDGERRLTVRLSNARAERVSRVTLCVTELDENGRRIGQSRHTLDVDGAPDGVFVPEQTVLLDERTCDCNVVAESARYGAYEYHAGKDGASVAYVGDRQAPSDETAGASYAEKAGKDGISVKRRKLKAPLLVTLALIASIVISVFAVYAHMAIFVKTEKTFLHHGVEYAFENDDRSDGSNIYVVGYYGARARVVIPDKIEGHTVTHIASGAFKNNTSLVSIAFKSEMPIGDHAFENCNSLKTVDFDNVTAIGESAFKNSYMLQSVKITDKISEIPQEAFAGCTGLADVTVEMSGTPIKIGRHAFTQCLGLKNVDFKRRIDFSGDERNYFARSNIERLHLVEFDNNSIASLFGGGDDGEFSLGKLSIDYMPTVPAGFAENIATLTSFETLHTDTPEIGDRAFYSCYRLKDFMYPVAVKKVGEYAFYGTAIKAFDCASLESMGDYAFADCASLELANLSGNTALTVLPVGAFLNCSSLARVTVPVGITEILPFTFSGCSSLTSVKYADGGTINSIRKEAFRGCKSLTTFDAPRGLSSIDEYAFADCTGFTAFTVPDGVLTVGQGIVDGCINLKSFTTPFVGSSENGDKGYLGHMFGARNANGVNYVPESLKKVTVTKTRTLADNAFRSLEYITEIVLPSTLTSIGVDAFFECKSLTDIDLPLGLRRIGAEAFGGCVGLTELTLPDTVTEIGAGVFVGCDGLKKLTMPYPNTALTLGELFGSPEIESNGQYVPIALKTVAVSSAARLPDNAFDSCGWVENIELPDELTSIGKYAFRSCAALKSLVIPKSVRSIGGGILINCNGIASLTTPFVGTERYPSQDENVRYDYKYGVPSFFQNVEYGYFYEISRSLKKIVLTDSAHIAGNAFNRCSYLEQLVLDCDVYDIGDSAFSDCHKLFEIFDYGSLVLTVGGLDNGGIAANALAVHTSRDEPALPQADNDGYRFVSGNADGKGDWYLIDYPYSEFDAYTMNLPESASENGYTVDEYAVWQYLFYQGNIKEFTAPSSVTAIGNNAFMYCWSLERVVFDTRSAMTVVPAYAFYSCSNLYDVVLPDGVTEIGNYAFYNCGRLKRFTVSADMTSIGAHAFESCVRLFEIYNMSSLDIRAGYAGYGDISLKARRVYSRDDILRDPDICLPNVTIDGMQYIKLGDGGIDWWLVDYYRSGNVEDDSVLEFKPFDYTGVGGIEHVTRFEIYDNALSATDSVRKLIIGNVIKAVNTQFAWSGFVSEIEFVDNGGAYDEIEIGADAFSHIYSGYLRSVKSSIDISSIGANAFGRYADLTATFDGRVGAVCTNAFSSVDGNAKLSTKFADIGELQPQAFGTDGALVDIKAGNIDVISGSVFDGNANLTSVEFGNVGRIDDGAFASCTGLTRAKFGEVRAIGNNAFSACSSLSSFTSGASFEGLTVGASAFSDCGSLARFEYSGRVAAVGEYAFRNDAALTRVTLGGADSIEARAFIGCYGLDRVTFTGDVGSIGTGAFNNTGVTVLRFGGNVGSIGSSAFANCYNLKSVDFGGSLSSLGIGAFSGCGMLAKIALPSSLTAIPERAFFGCTALREIALPRALRSLDSSAFSECGAVLMVYNPSALNVSGTTYFDEPVAIVDNESDAVVEYRTQGMTEFAKILGNWYHISGWSSRNGYVVLPTSLNVGGVTVTEVRIAKYITNRGQKVVVGKGITAISPKAFGSNTTVYFDGTPAEWRAVYGGSSVEKVYYRKDCLHGDDGYWRVGDDDLPTLTDTVLPETLWKTTVSPTCTSEGEQTAVCPHCGKALVRTLAMLEHDVKDGACTVCKRAAVVLTADNVGSVNGVTVVNDAKYAFEISAGGRIQSTNKASDSSAAFTLTFARGCDVQFEYGVSSEATCDMFTVAVNGVKLDELSGEVRGRYMRLTLKAGDVLTFAYTKDASVSNGDDRGYINNLTVI